MACVSHDMNNNLKALLQIKTIESYQKMQSWELKFHIYLRSLKPAHVRYPVGSWQRNLLVWAGDIDIVSLTGFSSQLFF